MWDTGSWDLANCLMPGEDICGKTSFASTDADLEGVVAFQEAMRKLRGAKRHDGAAEETQGQEGQEKGGGKHVKDGKKK